MHIDDFDFPLPDELVAQHPAERRDEARLLALGRQDGRIEHLVFRDLVDRLRPADVLVLNRTRVVPARLHGTKERTGGKVELLLLRRLQADVWLAMGRPLSRLRAGDIICLGDGRVRLEIVDRAGDRVHVRVPGAAADDGDPTGFAALLPLAEAVGEVPLPPYIRRPAEAEDARRYQTVYARDPGSIAAPTAGLHFTDELLQAVRDRGVEVAFVVLHVGPGTFEPVRVSDPRQHRLEAEYYRLSPAAAQRIRARRAAGGRVVAVGTTTVRTLETCAAEGQLQAGEGWTDLVITPPYRFRAVDAMVTNFHLPRSSLLLLVGAFAGAENMLAAYREAVASRYRFYSYGDAMWIA